MKDLLVLSSQSCSPEVSFWLVSNTESLMLSFSVGVLMKDSSEGEKVNLSCNVF